MKFEKEYSINNCKNGGKHLKTYFGLLAFIFCDSLAFIYSTTVTCAELNLTAEKNETPNQWKRVE